MRDVVRARDGWRSRALVTGMVLGVSFGCGGNNWYGRLETATPTGGMGTGGQNGSPAGGGGLAVPIGTQGLGDAGPVGNADPAAAGGAGAPSSRDGGSAPSGTGGPTPGSAGSDAGGFTAPATGGRSALGGTTGLSGGTGGNGGGGGADGAVAVAFQRFRHGINLGNRLDPPTEGAWGPVLHAADFPLIARRGFDHIRLPIRFSGHALASAPYTIDPVFLARVDWAVAQALSAGVAIVLDLSQYLELYATPDLQRARFLAIWSQLADHYRGAGPEVAFEPLSEPSPAMTATWNALAASVLQIIRATNPTRVVIIDSANIAAAATLVDLSVPDDANVMASFHAYDPGLFTFQGMAWMGPIYGTTSIVFPGPPDSPVTPVQAALATPWAKQWFDDYNHLPADQNPSGPKSILAEMQQAKDFVARTGHPVYNGQWGPQLGGVVSSRVRFLRMVREECDKANVGWAVWEDGVNMKLFDSTAGTWVETLVAPLFP